MFINGLVVLLILAPACYFAGISLNESGLGFGGAVSNRVDYFLGNSFKFLAFFITIFYALPVVLVSWWAFHLSAPSFPRKGIKVEESYVELLGKGIRLKYDELSSIAKPWHNMWVLVKTKRKKELPLGFFVIYEHLPSYKELQSFLGSKLPKAEEEREKTYQGLKGTYKLTPYKQIIIFLLASLFFAVIHAMPLGYGFILVWAIALRMGLFLSLGIGQSSFWSAISSALFAYLAVSICNFALFALRNILPFISPSYVRIDEEGIFLKAFFKETFIPRSEISVIYDDLLLFNWKGKPLSFSFIVFRKPITTIFRSLIVFHSAKEGGY